MYSSISISTVYIFQKSEEKRLVSYFWVNFVLECSIFGVPLEAKKSPTFGPCHLLAADM